MADGLLKIANDSILKTKGVAGIAFPGIIPIFKEQGIELEVYVNVNYGEVIPEVAWKIQENIKKSFDNSSYKISKINLHIEGIEIAKED